MEPIKSLINVSIDGKALEKLIDAVSKGIATLYNPRRIRKEADANAYAIQILQRAVRDADSSEPSLDIKTQERIVQRIVAQEIRRQDNIDTVVELAAESLKGKQVTEEPVNEDWATRFFGIVQDVSQEEMRTFWARVLAKEVEAPSSISFRTIEILRNISVEEARLFEKVAPYIINSDGNYLIINDKNILVKNGINYVDLVRLAEVGLLQPIVNMNKQFYSYDDRDSESTMQYGKYLVFISLPAKSKQVDLPIALLTRAGQDIFGLLEPESKIDFLKEIASFIKKKYPQTEVEYSIIISESNGTYTYRVPRIRLE